MWLLAEGREQAVVGADGLRVALGRVPGHVLEKHRAIIHRVA